MVAMVGGQPFLVKSSICVCDDGEMEMVAMVGGQPFFFLTGKFENEKTKNKVNWL